jgi:RimJ/RimL family protein N-acetyltransferase
MTELIEIETKRLRLRQWRLEDFAPFAELNSDPRVMEFFPAPLTRAASDQMAGKCQELISERGWGFWAAELKETQQFIGFVGLHIPSDQLPFSPCVEIGWRLAFQHWGKGLATEAAKYSLKVGFETLSLKEIVSFTAIGNYRSRAVMERLGMKESGTFEHYHVPEGNVLRQHSLYRLTHEARDA